MRAGLGQNYRYTPTVEDLFELELGDGMRLHLLDTAGSFTFPAMRRLAISNGDVFVVVFAMDSDESLRRAADAVNEVRLTSHFTGLPKNSTVLQSCTEH